MAMGIEAHHQGISNTFDNAMPMASESAGISGPLCITHSIFPMPQLPANGAFPIHCLQCNHEICISS